MSRNTGAAAPTVVAVVSEELFAEFFSGEDVGRLHAVAERLGGTFVRVDRLTGTELGAARIVITSWGVGPFDAAVLAALPQLALIAHTGATIKPFATDELFDRGILVTQAGAGMARSVAEVSLTFTLALLHRVPEMHNALRAGDEWYDADAVGVQREILGTAVAVIGASRTGRAYLELIRALGAEPLLVDPTIDTDAAAALGAELVPLDEALRRAQVVAVHAPTLPETHHLIGRRELALMRDGAGLVNTARSWLVDEAALIDELKSGRLNAAIDVFDEEPCAADSPFRSLPGVLVTPHRAAGTHQGRRRQGRIVTDEVAAFAAGLPLTHAVSRDQLSSMA
ncbi:hydroxyacid dehydrogenase [Microbacterium sp. W1N]|uniref:hydroxyacid dehydrogenase n=1 Tax=Microbacterium festucae TaxID=2977531 RepID=UPI0021C22A81|nr:hydroxyacid dehydrogenase [Microbacterium festucae]MCT9821207.1 hydroxyacid dehydrogenase [Microbacterium festucae]